MKLRSKSLSIFLTFLLLGFVCIDKAAQYSSSSSPSSSSPLSSPSSSPSVSMVLEQQQQKEEKEIKEFDEKAWTKIREQLPKEKQREMDDQLIEAAKSGDTKQIVTLLQRGASAKELFGNTTALIEAIENEHIATTRLLLKAKANSNAQNICGNTALMAAVYMHHPTLVEALLESDADANQKDQYGWTALIFAAFHGDSESVKLLTKFNADVNATTNYGYTALMQAVAGHPTREYTKNYIDCVKLLLDARANVGIKRHLNETALSLAKQPEVIALLEAAQTKAKNYQTLIELVKSNDDKALEVQLKTLDANAESDTGWTALMEAAYRNYPTIINVLLNAKAKIDTQDNKGTTALMIATIWTHPKSITSLLKAKANVNIKDNRGKTALDWALHNDRHYPAVILHSPPEVIDLLTNAAK